MSYVSVSYSEAWDFSIFVISGVTMIVVTAATSFQTFLVNLDGRRWGEGGNLKDWNRLPYSYWSRENRKYSCCIGFIHQKFIHHFGLWQSFGLQVDLAVFGLVVLVSIWMPWVPLLKPSSPGGCWTCFPMGLQMSCTQMISERNILSWKYKPRIPQNLTDISEIQNTKFSPGLCLFYFANNQNYIRWEWLLWSIYLGNYFSFEFFRLLIPPIDFDYLLFDKGNAGSPCCAKDQRCLHSSRLLPSLILQCRISELIAFSSIWHFIFHISSSDYGNILSFRAGCSENIAFLTWPLL